MERSIRHHFKLAVATVLMAAACLFVGFSSAAYAADAPDIDGELSEWSAVAHQSSTDPDVSYWQIAKDEDGNVYLAISGTASTQWVDWQWNKSIGATIKGADRQNTVLANLAGAGPRNDWDPPLIGTYKQVNDANGNTPGPMYIEVKIDKSSFNGDSNYSLKFAGTTVKASDITTFKAASDKPSESTSSSSESGSGSSNASSSSSSEPSGSSSASSSSSEPAKYSGITIDGNFNDWDAVHKVETQDPNEAHHQNLAAEAMVFDGDYVYLYVEEGKGGDASGAGMHGNGQFAITTDLGHELMIQLHNNNGKSSVTAGTEEVKSKHVGRKWEIAVPKSMLPAYQKTLSFGLYQQDPTVKDVANLNTSDKGNAGTFSGIVYDGDYSDWTAYPHTQIQYATAGTQEHVTDALGALYSDGDTLYTHVKTVMPEHVKNEKGSEFLWSVTYDFGDGRILYPSYAEVDADGTIHWYSGGETLSPGTHELYIFDTSCWRNSTNINNLTSGDRNYGKITVTVDEKGAVDEMESEMDLTQVAKKFNCDAGDFKTIRAQFGRLGQEWLSSAGTSTNPLLGTGIAVGSVAAAVGGYGAYRRRKTGVPATAAAGSKAGTIASNGSGPTAQA